MPRWGFGSIKLDDNELRPQTLRWWSALRSSDVSYGGGLHLWQENEKNKKINHLAWVWDVNNLFGAMCGRTSNGVQYSTYIVCNKHRAKPHINPIPWPVSHRLQVECMQYAPHGARQYISEELVPAACLSLSLSLSPKRTESRVRAAAEAACLLV